MTDVDTAISAELVREIATRCNPFVAVGTTVPLNVRATGWLADVVESDGWDAAFAKYPEVGRFLLRLTDTLEALAAGGIEAAERPLE